ncbi:MAG TPA: hypothetical protein V6D07_06840 [Trichocoleus sp.]
MPVPPSKPSPNLSPTVGVTSWLQQVMSVPSADLHVKLRGNILHILCETPTALEQTPTLLNLVRGLLEPQEAAFIKQAYPQVYQLYLYNRVAGQPVPAWTAPIYLNRLERHLAQLVLESQDEDDLKATQELLEVYTQGDPEALKTYAKDGAGGAIVLSNLSLARKGDPEAIAWYLSETLSALDVGVWVSIKAIPGTAHLSKVAVTVEDHGAEGGEAIPEASEEATIPRLWVLCEAVYSPDPSLIAKPTAERLRQLQLTQFKDAVLLMQVRGETTPDWSLRIDLTPEEEMLREWGRWGDSDAIAKLLQPLLAPLSLKASAELKETTLYLICQPVSDDEAALSSWASVQTVLVPFLETLAPQGVHRVMVYGQTATDPTPAWVGCADLPAADHEALALSPEALAKSGDLPAIAFLLTRLLNPNLEEQVATGGLRVQLLVRDKLLHVMVDGPVAPQRRQVASTVSRYLRQLTVTGVQGARVYGRRSGQAQPSWSYGEDFTSRRRLVPESSPEFTASDAYVNDLLVNPDGPVRETDLTEEDEQLSLEHLGSRLLQSIRQGLMRSHLFAPQQTTDLLQTTPEADLRDSFKIAVVWGAVGLLLALQADWVLGQVLRPPAAPGVAEATTAPDLTTPSENETASSSELPDEFANLNWGSKQSDSEGNAAFGRNGFTDEGSGSLAADPGTPFVAEPVDLPTSPQKPIAITDDLLLLSPYPSFRSQQLDEKLALYHQHLQQSGPPDVLLVGSSRALRGVDPAALQKELASLGYANVSVFNFGVNGATAQVVDLTIRRILKPSQLPKLIVWADGARAFNSGRTDVTYNAITASEGYQELLSAESSAPSSETPDAAASSQKEAEGGLSLSESYLTMDSWLSENLANFSAVYPDREGLKTWFQQKMSLLTKPVALGANQSEEQLDAVMPEGSVIDFDGFLALSIRFNPATYYQKHARVPGLYDGDYESFRLEGQQDEAFRQLMKFTQTQKIPIVFINTPLTDEYLDDYRKEAEDAFLKYMLRLSTSEEGFVFRDLAQAWPTRYDYFSDPSHLNRYGAYQVSNQIAQDPMIPWPQPELEQSP